MLILDNLSLVVFSIYLIIIFCCNRMYGGHSISFPHSM